MALRGADLLLKQVEIVQQPFGRRGDVARFFDLQGPLVIIPQDFFI